MNLKIPGVKIPKVKNPVYKAADKSVPAAIRGLKTVAPTEIKHNAKKIPLIYKNPESL